MGKGDEEFPVPADASSKPDEGGSGLRCPDCDYIATGEMAPAKLGLHRRRAHGTTGKTAGKKRGRRRSSSGSAPPRTPSPIRQVRDSIAEATTKGGALLLPVMPLPAAYMMATGDELADVVARLASRNPKLLETLSKSSDAMDYLALGAWTAGLLVAAGVNLGRIPVDHPAAQVYRLPQIAEDAGLIIEQVEPDADDRAGAGDHMGPGGPAAQPVVAGSVGPS